MANSLVKAYREALAANGQTDPRSDEEITLQIGRTLRSTGGSEAELGEDFRDEFLSLNEQSVGEGRTPILGEVKAGFTRGMRSLVGLAGYGAGLAADLVGADDTAKKIVTATKEWEQGDGSDAPAVASMDDVHDVTSGVKYVAGQVGNVLPSVGEAVAAGLVGMGLGSAVAPGPGTVAGGLAGAAGKGIVRKMVAKKAAELVARGAAKETAESMAYNLVAKQIGGVTAAALNSWALSSAEVYSGTENPGLALGAGAVAAVPDTFLPSYFLGKVLKPAASAAEKELAGGFWKRFAMEAAKTVPLEAGTESFQELVNIAAEKYEKGEAPELTDEDWKRMRESAVGGAIGGGLFAPVTATLDGRTEPTDAKPKPTPALDARKAATEPVAPMTTDEQTQYDRIVAAVGMTPEQREARLEVLAAQAKRTSAEEKEMQTLLAERELDPSTATTADAKPPEASTTAPAPDARLDVYGKGYRDLEGKKVKVGEREIDDAGKALREADRQLNILNALKRCLAGGAA